MNDAIPFLSFDGQSSGLRKKISSVLREVYDSNNFILGTNVEEFERRYATFSGTRYCATTGNGLDALSLSLKAIGVGVGDEVIVPANTCIPTWMAVTAARATVVPVEPDIKTYNLDATKISQAITSKTRAIIPVHLYGQACEMTSIEKIAKKHRLSIIEDNAQAHGAQHNGRSTGSFGVINATSFYPTKNLGAIGDGGAVTTNDRSLYEKVIRLRNYGSGKKNVHEFIGVNSRLDEIQAAVLSLKLADLDKANTHRQRIAELYLNGLQNVGDIELPYTAIGSTHVYHLFVVRTSRRDQLIRHLQRRGIGTMIHYPTPPHLQEAYHKLGLKKGSLPITELIADTVVSLPLWPGMSKPMVERVISSVRTFYGHK